MDNKLILLEAHKLGIKLDRTRKVFKTGNKGKVHSIFYKPDCSLLNKHSMKSPDELKRYDGPEDEENVVDDGPTAPEPVTEAAEA